MQVANGTYTGNGADARDITGVGFDPHAVLIFGINASANAVLRTADMTANTCKELIATTAIASLPDILTALITDGFTVDNEARSNADTVVYYYLALRDNGAPDLDIGTYTGNGANSQAITGVGFEPTAVWIFGGGARLPQFAVASALASPAVWAGGSTTAVVESMDADGFTVGSAGTANDNVNANGETFYYIAIKDTEGLFEQTSFTGNATDNRDIAHGLSATPTFVAVTNAGGAFDTAVWTDDFAVGNSTRVDGVTNLTDRIQSVDATNVNVGTENEVNGSGVTMLMQVFAAGESSSIVNPTITTIVPDEGPKAGGTTITITGTGFVAGAAVTVGGAAATGENVINDTTMTAVTPAGTVGAQDVVVTNTDTGTVTSTGGFTYTQSNGWWYWDHARRRRNA